MNSIAIDLGFLQIYWYSIFIFLGILAGMIVTSFEMKRRKIDESFFINMIFYALILGVIGARLYYVIFNWADYAAHPIEILKIWNGGLAIHGGILFASLFILIYTRKYKQNTLKIFDILVVGLILGQAIGRWGNFFNQEAYGMVTTKAALENSFVPKFIIDGMYIGGSYRQPTFLYESLWDLFGFIALLLTRRYKYLKNGQLTGVYFMWYSVGRFIIEGFRTDSLMLGPIRMAQLVSVLLFLLGLFLFLRARKKGTHFENLYKEEEAHEVRF